MNLTRPNILAVVARYGVFGFAMITAISQLGIAVQLLNILFTGLVACLVVCLALSFGLGGQSVAADIARSWLSKRRSSTPTSIGPRTVTDSQDVDSPVHH